MNATTEASDRRAVGLGLATAIIMIGQFVAAKASGDTMFLSHYDVTELPRAVIASALLSMQTTSVPPAPRAFAVARAWLTQDRSAATEWIEAADLPEDVRRRAYMVPGGRKLQ